MERRRYRTDHFLVEARLKFVSVGRVEGVRNALKVSELNNSVKEISYQESLSPCLVVSGQDASGPWDGCIRSRWLRTISPIQI